MITSPAQPKDGKYMKTNLNAFADQLEAWIETELQGYTVLSSMKNILDRMPLIVDGALESADSSDFGIFYYFN